MENNLKDIVVNENEKIEKEFEKSEKVDSNENKKIEDEYETQLKIEKYYLDNEDPDVEEENTQILLNAA